ncbi:MAG: TlpA family protein disulfide reductase [Bacteroidetes bacterium]|nr:TlpA family protein disulfide reductase [Bacteroidota bacterium]
MVIKEQGIVKRLFFISIFVFNIIVAGAQSVPAWKITDLEKYIQSSKTPVIVSFWATYCVPCLAEIPYFEKKVSQYKKDGITILLVSLDMEEQYPKAISSLVKKMKFTSTVVWLNETDADYFCPKVDSSWSGALPSTLFVNNKTGYHKFFEEKIPEDKLEREIKAMIAGKLESR